MGAASSLATSPEPETFYADPAPKDDRAEACNEPRRSVEALKSPKRKEKGEPDESADRDHPQD